MLLRMICTDESLTNGPGYLVAGESYRVGRSSRCAFVVSDLSVSRFHAELSVNKGAVVLKDLNSRNGTFVDGLKIQETELRPGQSIHFGGVRFELVDHTQPDASSNANSEISTFLFKGRPHVVPASLHLLSEAQRRVLDLLLVGMSEKEVATRLEISQHTVHNHVKEIYRKMNVNSRSELLALFVEAAKALRK